MKTLSKLLSIFLFSIIIGKTHAQVVTADVVLTGGPAASYSGIGVSGTFDVTFANNTFVDIPAGYFRIVVSMPPGFVFNATYPGVPAGWAYAKIDDLDASLTPTTIVSGTVPSFQTFSVPFTTVAPVTLGAYLGQVQSLNIRFVDPNPLNNTPGGFTTISAVLPVDFLNVNATIKNCQAQVDWKVANQVSLKQYELESSTDGINFTTGKIVPINNQNAYSAALPVNGDSIYFYRVKAVDLDGKYKYSATTSVKANCTGRQGAFLMYPNPVMKGHQVIVTSTTNESTMYRVLDMAGKTMQEGRFTGNTTLQIFTGGTYIVDLQSASASTKYKLVVQ